MMKLMSSGGSQMLMLSSVVISIDQHRLLLEERSHSRPHPPQRKCPLRLVERPLHTPKNLGCSRFITGRVLDSLHTFIRLMDPVSGFLHGLSERTRRKCHIANAT